MTAYYIDKEGYNVLAFEGFGCTKIPASCLTKRTREVINNEIHEGKLPANDHNLTKAGRQLRDSLIEKGE